MYDMFSDPKIHARGAREIEMHARAQAKAQALLNAWYRTEGARPVRTGMPFTALLANLVAIVRGSHRQVARADHS